jgi:hypothetical protein
VIEIVRKPVQAAPSQPVPGDPDRAIAEWVLSAGGWVTVNEQHTPIKARDELPGERFRTSNVFMPGNRTIGNADLQRLHPLPELAMLDITGTRIGDDGIVHLPAIRGLGGLRADFTLVTNRGAESIKECTNLQYLSLGGTAVSNDGLRHIKELPRLNDLGVPNTAVSDDGLRHLSEQFSLTRLRLQKTGVTDAGLAHLLRLTRLVEVDVRETAVTLEGVTSLRKAVPKCKVLWDGNEGR